MCGVILHQCLQKIFFKYAKKSECPVSRILLLNFRMKYFAYNIIKYSRIMWSTYLYKIYDTMRYFLFTSVVSLKALQHKTFTSKFVSVLSLSWAEVSNNWKQVVGNIFFFKTSLKYIFFKFYFGIIINLNLFFSCDLKNESIMKGLRAGTGPNSTWC